MPRVLIVEGPDNVGKTTFLNLLNYPIHHASGSMDAIQAEAELGWIVSQPDVAMLDRSMIGEYVYGPSYRGSRPSARYDEVVQGLRSLDPLILLIYAVKSDFIRLGQREKSDEHLSLQRTDEAESISRSFVRVLCETGPWNVRIFPLGAFESLDDLHVMMHEAVHRWMES